jgi:hypothetical protein
MTLHESEMLTCGMMDIQPELCRIFNGIVFFCALDLQFGSIQPCQRNTVLMFVEAVRADLEAKIRSTLFVVARLPWGRLEQVLVEVVCEIKAVLFPGLGRLAHHLPFAMTSRLTSATRNSRNSTSGRSLVTLSCVASSREVS